MDSYAEKDKGDICQVRFCRTPRQEGRRVCSKHRARRYAQTNPVGYAYDALRGNARRRGKPFHLTREQFREWCARTGYIELKGRSAGAMTIDRIDESRGYEIGNIQVLTLGENIRKSWAYRADASKRPGQ